MTTKMLPGEDVAPPVKRMALANRRRAMRLVQELRAADGGVVAGADPTERQRLNNVVVACAVRYGMPVEEVAKVIGIPEYKVIEILQANRVPHALPQRPQYEGKHKA